MGDILIHHSKSCTFNAAFMDLNPLRSIFFRSFFGRTISFRNLWNMHVRDEKPTESKVFDCIVQSSVPIRCFAEGFTSSTSKSKFLRCASGAREAVSHPLIKNTFVIRSFDTAQCLRRQMSRFRFDLPYEDFFFLELSCEYLRVRGAVFYFQFHINSCGANLWLTDAGQNKTET